MKLKMLRKSFALSAAAALAAFPNPGFAAPGGDLIIQNKNATANSSTDAVSASWTPQALQSAKPMELIVKGKVASQSPAPVGQTGTRGRGENGKPPTVNLAPQTQPLFTPRASTANSTPQPNNYGSDNAHFTSSRLLPLSADTEYPYRTVGKLFFRDQNGVNYVCSASVLRPRVVLTAGHCIHKGSGGGSGFFKDFLFIPAYRDGMAPYGKWSWSWAIVTGEWANGGGGVPNSADYAIIEFQDQSINGTVRKIGDVTGYLGYHTERLRPNHATLLGYPCNLDSCEKMHQVTAGSDRPGGNNTVLYGSDMRGGSSGGPWVQNFGSPANGQTAGKNTGLNQIIGVTSYGYVSTEPLVQGSSILNESFLRILDSACRARAGNC
jgi:V8-like Glu-specific endopeptidase